MKAQAELLRNHLVNIGKINTDEARITYSIVNVPARIFELGKALNIKHTPIMRENKGTGAIRQIMEYELI